jgi:hypothetical protein
MSRQFDDLAAGGGNAPGQDEQGRHKNDTVHRQRLVCCRPLRLLPGHHGLPGATKDALAVFG